MPATAMMRGLHSCRALRAEASATALACSRASDATRASELAPRWVPSRSSSSARSLASVYGALRLLGFALQPHLGKRGLDRLAQQLAEMAPHVLPDIVGGAGP